MFADDEIYTTGPLAGMVSSDTRSWATKVHYQNSDVILGLILLHLLASAFYFIVLKINLVKPMITGKKDLPDVENVPGVKNVKERPVVAVACLLVAVSICLVIFNR